MSNRHLINQQKIALRMGNHQEALGVQQEISSLYWRRIVPAFEGLFDRLAGPDVLVKLDLLEIDLGNISTQDLHSPLLVDKMVKLLEAALLKAIQEDQTGNVTKPIHMGQFQLWLYFLEHGYLPADSAFPKEPLIDWYNDIFEALAREESAIDRLSRLVSTCPQAMERLILQFDYKFLQQIVVLFTGFKQNRLGTQISDTTKKITANVQTLLEYIQKERHKESEIQAAVDELLEIFLEIIPFLKKNKTRQVTLQKKLTVMVGQNSSPVREMEAWLTDPGFLNYMLGQGVPIKEIHAIPSQVFQKLEGVLAKKRVQSSAPNPIVATYKEKILRQLETNAWRLLLIEVLVQRKKAGTEKLLNNISHHKTLQPGWYIGGENINYINEKLKIHNSKKLYNSTSTSFSLLKIKAPSTVIFKEKYLRNLKVDLSKINLNRSLVRFKKVAEEETATMQHWLDLKKKLGIKVELEPGKIQPLEFPEGHIKEVLPPLDTKYFFVPQAGMVLLHPFLSKFFQKMDLLEDSQFSDPWQQQKAILLLHFLATGEDRCKEFELILPKHLIGWPLNLPIDHAINIKPEEKAEGENLLQAVIEHWGALGSTSIDGLREGFLQREGKLEKRSTGWLLRVEQKTMDILLDRLPWNLSLIKLPWMEDMLKVEWK